MKFLIPFALLLSTLTFAQGNALKEFSKEAEQFNRTKLTQAQYLLRRVLPMGIIATTPPLIPDQLSAILEDAIKPPLWQELDVFLKTKGISENDLGGHLTNPICSNANGTKAKYFVIHDTSTPNFKNKALPLIIDSTEWAHNNVHKVWKDKKKAHVFVGRTGHSYSPVHFDIPWRATKFELSSLNATISKGLFVHIELVQPRRSDPGKWANNDVLAPPTGFTIPQYQRLSLLYIAASIGKGDWLIPTYHATLDNGIPDAHDNPQNFDLRAFDSALTNLLAEINGQSSLKLWATYYYTPTVIHARGGLPLLNASHEKTGFRLDSLDWCDAAIQGTVAINKDGEITTLNYAGRSDSLLFDCRKCSIYRNYDGYLKTGKVLWSESIGFGKGVKDFNLVPCKTIAVDPEKIPIGSVLFIPDAVGTLYDVGDGIQAAHDGYFFAGDVGSKIIGNHIDVFIGNAIKNPFKFVSSLSTLGFDAYLVTDKDIINALTELHQN
ncbi:MAG: 3D (Asp-Asp-Asp) domain-containing protein [Flavobacteriaceae bacterium]|jgi:3D (Asp-Asp-Asp) domain-containing protein